MDVLINRVAESGLLTIDLGRYYPDKEMVVLDIKDFLFHGLILKEKEFRDSLKMVDWTQYHDKIVLIQNSADAIVPLWSFMLISKYLSDEAYTVFNGTKEVYLVHHYKRVIENIDADDYKDKRVVIKGCADVEIPAQAYIDIVHHLIPHVQSLMFGEPCSTVPIFKRPRNI